MKKVIVFGTFDIFHPGHEYFLKKSKRFGEELTVVVARDKTVYEVKKRYSLNNEEERVEKILRSNIADKVVLGGKGDKYDVIKRNEPDIICLGYDQEFFIDELKEKLQEFGFLNTKVFRIKSFKPEVYKSSKLRNLGK